MLKISAPPIPYKQFYKYWQGFCFLVSPQTVLSGANVEFGCTGWNVYVGRMVNITTVVFTDNGPDCPLRFLRF